MSALFPNVPDLPGVPPVVRAVSQLQSISNGSNTALASAQSALDLVNVNDLSGAATALGVTSASAGASLITAEPIFSASGAMIGSLSGAVANAESAIGALGAGMVSQAVTSIEQTITAAQEAVSLITDIVSPVPLPPLVPTGGGVDAGAAQQWGLFTQDGALAAPVDNVLAFEAALEARISDYPVAPNPSGGPTETVGFGSYNKVIVPFDIRLVLSRGGSVDDRKAFLDAIQAAWQSIELFNVVTPEQVYTDVNVVGVRRMATADRGMGLMALEVALRKIRQTATLTFTQTKEPSGSGQVQDGSVQAAQPASAQAYAGTAQ